MKRAHARISARRCSALLVFLAVTGVSAVFAQPSSTAKNRGSTVEVSGQVVPPPGHVLKIEVGDSRGRGDIAADGTFRFPVTGSRGEIVNVVVRDDASVIYNNTQTLGTPWEMQVGATDSSPPADPSVLRAILWSVLFTIIAGLVELQFRAKAELASCLGRSSALYITMLCFFNALAAALAAGLLRNKVPGGPFFTPMFYALFGVFAFETVLSNTNVTVFEKGVLAFQEWTGKARDPAVTAVGRRQSQLENDRTTALANRLTKMPDVKLRTYVLDSFKESGKKLIEESEATAAKYGADTKFLVALAFAQAMPDRAAAAAKQEKA